MIISPQTLLYAFSTLIWTLGPGLSEREDKSMENREETRGIDDENEMEGRK